MKPLTDLFKSLSDPTRLKILFILSQSSHCVCELTALLKEPQSKISKHLSKLRDLGFIQSERNGQFIYYSLHNDHALLESFIRALLNHASQFPELNGLTTQSINITCQSKDARL